MRITVINPNSNTVYTERISNALEAVRRQRQVSIDCMTLAGAPLAIETDDDIRAVVGPLLRAAETLESAGIVIACFADPGLLEVRTRGTHTVLGCCEAAVEAALKYGSRIGLISTGDDVAADRNLMFSYADGIDEIVVQTLGVPTAEIPTHPESTDRMLRCGEALQQAEVQSVVLGCAGMASYAVALERRLSVPVIEPVSSAVNRLLDSLQHRV